MIIVNGYDHVFLQAKKHTMKIVNIYEHHWDKGSDTL